MADREVSSIPFPDLRRKLGDGLRFRLVRPLGLAEYLPESTGLRSHYAQSTARDFLRDNEPDFRQYLTLLGAANAYDVEPESLVKSVIGDDWISCKSKPVVATFLMDSVEVDNPCDGFWVTFFQNLLAPHRTEHTFPRGARCLSERIWAGRRPRSLRSTPRVVPFGPERGTNRGRDE